MNHCTQRNITGRVLTHTPHTHTHAQTYLHDKQCSMTSYTDGGYTSLRFVQSLLVVLQHLHDVLTFIPLQYAHIYTKSSKKCMESSTCSYITFCKYSTCLYVHCRTGMINVQQKLLASIRVLFQLSHTHTLIIYPCSSVKFVDLVARQSKQPTGNISRYL